MAQEGGQQNIVGNEGEEEVQAMEVDPAPNNLQIIAQMQHTIEELRRQMAANMNQHLLGAQPQAVEPREEAPPPELPEDGERRRLDVLLKILRSSPKFQGGTQEPWASL